VCWCTMYVVSPAIIHQYTAQEKDKINTGSYNTRCLYATKQNAKLYHIVRIYSTHVTVIHNSIIKTGLGKQHTATFLLLKKMLIDQNWWGGGHTLCYHYINHISLYFNMAATLNMCCINTMCTTSFYSLYLYILTRGRFIRILSILTPQTVT